MNGIRAEVKIHSAESCPITEVSDVTGVETNTISRTHVSNGAQEVTEEFVLDADASLDPVDIEDINGELREIFVYDSKRAFRFDRSRQHPCPCDAIEQFGCPILDSYARDGALIVTFHAPNLETLRDVVKELNEQWPGTNVRRLIRSIDDEDEQDLVLVDRSELTDRQQEVVKTAHEMGYFDHPKGANAGEVAEALGVNSSTFAEHLAAAQRKLLSVILEEGAKQ